MADKQLHGQDYHMLLSFGFLNRPLPLRLGALAVAIAVVAGLAGVRNLAPARSHGEFSLPANAAFAGLAFSAKGAHR